MQEEKNHKNRVKRLDVIATETILKQYPIVVNPYFCVHEFDLPKDIENSLWFVQNLLWAVEAKMLRERNIHGTCNDNGFIFYH